MVCLVLPWLYLIPFLHQTTTSVIELSKDSKLYLIPFLHQTTTSNHRQILPSLLYLIPFLHQTTTVVKHKASNKCCILFHFYIKPQLDNTKNGSICVVSYSISTSNHNLREFYSSVSALYLIPFLHQTTTVTFRLRLSCKLYLIPFLHQTTTDTPIGERTFCCILFHFYIKPQRIGTDPQLVKGCILFHFYIKPQHPRYVFNGSEVVSYSISTSNHNRYGLYNEKEGVVSYSISTSNHNSHLC